MSPQTGHPGKKRTGARTATPTSEPATRTLAPAQALVERAQAVAKAAGQPNVLFGVRAHNGTVFACCGDVEADGDTFEAALHGVVYHLREKARREASAARQVLDRQSRLDALVTP